MKKLVNVFATLRSPNIPARKVFSPLTVCVDARIISPLPAIAWFFHLLDAVSYTRASPLLGEVIVTSVSPLIVEDPPPEIVSILS